MQQSVSLKRILGGALVRGTLILTIAGFLTRILGFFYRIWLSGAMSTEYLGIYQMVFPVYGVCFTVYASGIQTAISKLVAERRTSARRILSCGLSLSLLLALLLSILLYETAPLLAEHFLFERRAAAALRVLSFIFPFCSITACLNGYYYGQSKSFVPAFTQLLEQIVRIAFVYALFSLLQTKALSCELAVLGLIAGEAASALFHTVFFLLSQRSAQRQSSHRSPVSPVFREVTLLAAPLSFNRLIVSLLHSLEASMVPFLFRKSGLTAAAALSHYGIINGMSMPFVLFPSAITNALAVLLLPAVSGASSGNEEKKLRTTIRIAVSFSLLLGLSSTVLFLLSGHRLGMLVFREPLAGSYLRTLAWLCPFLYLSSTLSSILNGLGKPFQTFLNSVLGMCVKILVILFFVPRLGIPGYFFSLLSGQLVLTLLDALLLSRLLRERASEQRGTPSSTPQ